MWGGDLWASTAFLPASGEPVSKKAEVRSPEEELTQGGILWAVTFGVKISG